MAKKEDKRDKRDKRKSVSRFEVVETDASKLTVEEESAIGASRVTELREKDKALMEEMQKEKEREEKNKKVRKWLKIGIVVLIILLLIARCSAGYVAPDKRNPIDIGLQDITTPEPTETKKPEEFMAWHLTISMNDTPTFENGKAKGKLMIENDEENVYGFFVEIYVKEKGEIVDTAPIYRSGVILPGNTLVEDTLDRNLPAGKYNCVAYFNAVSVKKTETSEDAYYLEGKAGSEITITVLNTVEETEEAGENG